MNIVDQRILIPAPSDVVWDFLSDITKNTSWQTDCRGVNFLTSKRGGPGTRWRQNTEKGREQVVEITAWYDRLGYQYAYVDGDPFRNTTGRIRLQEIPEGTVVQWTLTYEGGGMLSSLGGPKRQIEAAMIASLKALNKQVMDAVRNQKAQLREAKSLMRDAPDVEARAQYQPRHQPAVNLRGEGDEAMLFKPIAADEPIVNQPIPEPPVLEDDTRPRPVVILPPSASGTIDEPVKQTKEPEFLGDVSRFAPPPDYYKSDTEPVKAIRPEDLAPAMPSTTTPPPLTTDELDLAVGALLAEPQKFEPAKDAFSDNFSFTGVAIPTEPVAPASLTTAELNQAVDDLLIENEPVKTTEPTAELAFDDLLVKPGPASAPDTEELSFDDLLSPAAEAAGSEERVQASQPNTPVEPEPVGPVVLAAALAGAIALEPDPETSGTDKSDVRNTAAVSIWEVFGVPRPSETSELPAVTDVDTVPAIPAPVDLDATLIGFRPVDPLIEPVEAEPALPSESLVETTGEEATFPIEPLIETAEPIVAIIASEPILETPITEPMESVELANPPENGHIALYNETVLPSGRVGLRTQMRRQIIKVRRPI